MLWGLNVISYKKFISHNGNLVFRLNADESYAFIVWFCPWKNGFLNRKWVNHQIFSNCSHCMLIYFHFDPLKVGVFNFNPFFKNKGINDHFYIAKHFCSEITEFRHTGCGIRLFQWCKWYSHRDGMFWTFKSSSYQLHENMSGAN